MAFATPGKCAHSKDDRLHLADCEGRKTSGQFGWKFYIVNGGEQIDDHIRKCDMISMHMAFRVQDTLSQTVSALENSACTWHEH